MLFLTNANANKINISEEKSCNIENFDFINVTFIRYEVVI